MTTYTRILEKHEQIGIQKGEQIGIQKGEQKKEVDVVLNSFDNKLEISVICTITNLEEYRVMSILKEHGRV